MPYDRLTQGTGAINGRDAVDMASAFDTWMPVGTPWVDTSRLAGATDYDGVLAAWRENIVWGNSPIGVEDGENIVWGNLADFDGDDIVWDNLADENVVWGNSADEDNIVRANSDTVSGYSIYVMSMR